MKNIGLIILIAILVIAGFLAMQKFKRSSQQIQPRQEQRNQQPNQQDQQQPSTAPVPAPEIKNPQPEKQSQQPGREQPSTLKVRAPRENATISSPMRISGEARGWYFEGSFPVKVTDEMGNELGRGKAEALGEWTVDDFVPFEGAVSFSPGSATQGFVVFEKDNPSGLGENAESYAIPVSFSSRVQQ